MLKAQIIITIIIFVILIILLIRASRKPTIDNPIEAPKSISFKTKQAIKKSGIKNYVGEDLTNIVLNTNAANIGTINNGANVSPININSKLSTEDISRKLKKKKVRSSKESQCRLIFEKLFGEKFPTKRPDFLRNPETGKNLELDGYNESLQLAFEYDGEHHMIFPNTFHKTKYDFDKQQERDKFKREVCKNRDITLITIPHTVQYNDLETYITSELIRNGFEPVRGETSSP